MPRPQPSHQSTIYALAAQLADLLGRLRAPSDDRIEHMNAHALPRGCGPLLVAEAVARGLEGFVVNSVDIPRIARRVQLPAFEYDAHHPYVWPRSSNVDAGSLMFNAIQGLSSRVESSEDAKAEDRVTNVTHAAT